MRAINKISFVIKDIDFLSNRTLALNDRHKEGTSNTVVLFNFQLKIFSKHLVIVS